MQDEKALVANATVPETPESPQYRRGTPGAAQSSPVGGRAKEGNSGEFLGKTRMK